MISQSLSIVAIAVSQESVAYAVALPTSTVLFLVASLAETSRLPFDLAEAETELVAGFHVELAGAGFTFFFLAEYANLLATSAILTALFLGGYCVSARTSTAVLLSLSGVKRPRLGRVSFSESSTLCVALTVDCAACSSLLFVSLGASRGQPILAAVKRRSFECGFSHFSDTRQTFNVNFYLVSILFVLFDIEITLLVP